MAKLDFPSSPTDGQVYVAPNNVNYTWNSGLGVWTAKVASALTLTSPGVISGSPQVGQTLLYSGANATGGLPPYTYSWTWKAASNGSPLQTGGASYVIPASLVGDGVYVELTVIDSVPTSVTGTTSVFPAGGAVISYSTFPNSVFLPAGAPNASPASVSTATLHGTGTCSSWEDGFTTLTSAGGILFNVNGGAYSASPKSVSDGDTVSVIWDVTVISAAADGQVLSGTLTDGTYTNTYTLTIRRGSVIGLSGFSNLVDQPLSTAVTSDVVTPGGFNVPVSISFAGTASDPLTAIGVSVSGGAFSASPQTVNPGQSIQMQGTTGGANSTAYGVDITMGSPAATQTWTVTTTAVTPTIVQPSITSPANGSTDINPAVNSPAGIQLVGSTYTPLNGAGDPQTSSTWEVYEAIPTNPETSAIVSTAVVPSNWVDRGDTVHNGVGRVAYGNGVFVCAAGTNRVLRSTDGGVSWTNPGPVFATVPQAVEFGDGKFVSVCNNGNIYVSSNNGLSWSQATSGVTQDLNDIFYYNGLFVAVGNQDLILTSPDGVNWTTRRGPSGLVGLYTVVAGDGRFFAGGSQATLYSSTDGITWNPVSTGIFTGGDLIKASAYGNGTFIFSASTNGALTTDGGTTWAPAPGGALVLSFGGGLFILGDNSNIFGASRDGSSYTTELPFGPGTNAIEAVGYGDGVYVALNSLDLAANATIPAGATELTLTDATGLADMVVGDSVVEVGGGADASGAIAAITSGTPSITVQLSDANWTVGAIAKDTSRTATPPAPTTTPPDPARYTAVTGSPFTVSAAPFTTIDIPQADLATSSTYYARVQYATTNASAATSEWSAWSEFETASEYVIPPGTEMGGGYFGGQINVSGTIYNLIVAPLTGTGGQQGQYGGVGPLPIAYKTASPSNDGGATLDEAYGGLATTNFADADHPIFNWCVNGANGPRSNGGIGGFTDWYIPAKNELAILYFFLKPTGDISNTNYGSNPNSVAPYTPNTNYGPGFPNVSSSALFAGGAQSFSIADVYWSSTTNSTNTSDAWTQFFDNGLQNTPSKGAPGHYARAIRRVVA